MWKWNLECIPFCCIIKSGVACIWLIYDRQLYFLISTMNLMRMSRRFPIKAYISLLHSYSAINAHDEQSRWRHSTNYLVTVTIHHRHVNEQRFMIYFAVCYCSESEHCVEMKLLFEESEFIHSNFVNPFTFWGSNIVICCLKLKHTYSHKGWTGHHCSSYLNSALFIFDIIHVGDKLAKNLCFEFLSGTKTTAVIVNDHAFSTLN